MQKGWFGRIKPGDMIILRAGIPPIFGTQYLFFNNKKLAGHTKIPAFQKSEAWPEGRRSQHRSQKLKTSWQYSFFPVIPAPPHVIPVQVK